MATQLGGWPTSGDPVTGDSGVGGVRDFINVGQTFAGESVTVEGGSGGGPLVGSSALISA